MRRSRDTKDAADRAAAEEIAKTLVPTVITVTARAGAEGKLFGSVTTADIADAVPPRPASSSTARSSSSTSPSRPPARTTVPAKLHADVEFPVTVEVTAS